jgi:hypothetical protein
MPYIQKKQRELYDEGINMISSNLTELGGLSPGHLNYIISALIRNMGPKSYTEINAIIGVLESAKMELYRHIAVPYEDKKMEMFTTG